MSSTIELSNGKATLDQRGEYLLVVEQGTLVSPHEVYRYVTELELASQRMKLRRLLVDARSETGVQTPETRDAMWRWIRSQRYFDQVAYALRDEMTIARVNMTALSERLSVRAFPSVPEAHRWLARTGSRGSSTMLPAVARTPASVPPPAMAAPGAGSSVPPRSPVPASPIPMAAPPTPASATQRLKRITQEIELPIRDTTRLEPAARAEPARAEPARSEPARSEPARAEPARSEPARSEPARAAPARAEPGRPEPITRSYATLKTPAVDPASADEILRKRR